MKFISIIIPTILTVFTCVNCNHIDKDGDKFKTDSISSTVKSKIDYNDIGNQLLKNENMGGLAIGLSINKVTDLLGAPDEKTKPELWGADGDYHHTLVYADKSIELDIVGEDEKQQKKQIEQKK